MLKNCTKLLSTLLLLLSFQGAMAQRTQVWPTSDSATILASQFADITQIFRSDGVTMPAAGFKGWITKGVSSSNPAKAKFAQWEWKKNAKADRGRFSGGSAADAIASPSAANGAAVFDSDYLDGSGIAPGQHVGELISPIMNLTGVSRIQVEFNSYFRKFESECYVQFSTDGGTTWSSNAEVFPNKELAGNEASINTDTIKSKAFATLRGVVGNNNFRIKFIFNGAVKPDSRSYYYWIVDDVKIFSVAGTYNSKVNNFFAVAPNLFTPKDQLDTIRFLADVTDVGFKPNPNPKLEVKVWRAKDNALVYTGVYNQYPAALVPDSAYENRLVPQPLLPAALQQAGRYFGSYRISGDSSKVDFNPANDTASFQFWVTDTTNANSLVEMAGKTNFAKEDEILRFNRLRDDFWTGNEPRSSRYGNYFRLNSSNATVTSLMVNMGARAARGSNIYATLYEWKDANEDGAVDPNERTLVAAAERKFAKDAVIPGNAWFVFGLKDFNTNGNFYPKAKTDYLAMIEFDAPPITNPVDSNYLLMVFGKGYYEDGAMQLITRALNSPRYNFVFGKDDGSIWNTSGFSNQFLSEATDALSLRLNVLPFKLTSNPVVLTGNNKISLSPNPVSKDNFINVDVQLETASDALLRVMSIDGRLVAEQILQKFDKQNIQLDVSSYATGTYILQILTPEGIMTKKFVKAE